MREYVINGDQDGSEPRGLIVEAIDYLIVGAGFAGSVCAERLASAGKRVLLIDQRAHVGGNAYDEYDDAGILVHRYGAHIFHCNSQEAFNYLSRFTAWRPYVHRVLASSDGRLLPVPINQTTLEAFGGDEAAAKRALYEPYTRKQWGSYADELAPTVLARVQPRQSRDDRYFTDRYQVMPAQGYTKLFQRMLAHQNIRIMLKTTYMEVRSYLQVFCDDMTWPPLIYTGPIDEFFDYSEGRLPYRSATFEWVTYDCERFQSVGVVNHPNAEVPYTRIIEFKHLTGQQHPQTTIALEHPTGEGEPYWPVPTAASAALYRTYAERAKTTYGVHFVGRLGTFMYLDIHQVVAQALKLSAQLVNQEPMEAPCLG